MLLAANVTVRALFLAADHDVTQRVGGGVEIRETLAIVSECCGGAHWNVPVVAFQSLRCIGNCSDDKKCNTQHSRARSHMTSSGDQQEKSNVFRVFRGKSTVRKSGWFVDLSKRLIQSSLQKLSGKLRYTTLLHKNFRVFHKNYLVASAR